jgi:hypothetical protein
MMPVPISIRSTADSTQTSTMARHFRSAIGKSGRRRRITPGAPEQRANNRSVTRREHGKRGLNARPAIDRRPSRIWSGRRESNPRHTAWEAVVLPLNYARTSMTYVSAGPLFVAPRGGPPRWHIRGTEHDLMPHGMQLGHFRRLCNRSKRKYARPIPAGRRSRRHRSWSNLVLSGCCRTTSSIDDCHS